MGTNSVGYVAQETLARSSMRGCMKDSAVWVLGATGGLSARADIMVNACGLHTGRQAASGTRRV